MEFEALVQGAWRIAMSPATECLLAARDIRVTNAFKRRAPLRCRRRGPGTRAESQCPKRRRRAGTSKKKKRLG